MNILKNIELYPLRANCMVGELHLNKDVLKVSENLITIIKKIVLRIF